MASASESSSNVERLRIRTSVAVRGESGFYFGTLLWIEPRRVLVELDAELADGEAIDCRITLAPTSGTALFRGNIVRGLPIAPGESRRYLLGIQSFFAEDKPAFEVWTENIRAGGTLARHDGAISQSTTSGVQARSSSEVREALERMSRRPLGDAPGTLTDPFGARSDTVAGGPPGGGRASIRDAPKSALDRRGPASPAPGRVVASAPVAPPAPGRVVASAPVAPPAPSRVVGAATNATPAPGTTVRLGAATNATPAPGTTVRLGAATNATPAPGTTVRLGAAPPPTGPDPSYAVTATRTATWLAVTWSSAEAFARDAPRLGDGVLRLSRGDAPLPEREPLRVLLRFRAFQAECDAAVVGVRPDGVTYLLRLDGMQLEALAAAARG